MIRKLLVCFTLLLTGSMAYASESGNTAPDNNTVIKSLPATYVGTLPCADCEGIRWQLNLLPDNIFHLRQTYLKNNKKMQFDRIGNWQITKEKTLKLETPGENNIAFEKLNKKQIRLLNQEGQPIQSQLNYNLKHRLTFKPIEPKLMLSGMYSYQADAGRISLCETGQTLPVAVEADNAALEAAYLAARTTPGEPLLVQVQGRIAKRQPMEEVSMQTSLIVEHFIKVFPGQTCPRTPQAIPLAGTYWKLIYLDDATVENIEDRRQAHLVFDEKEQRVAGSGGCNRIMGSYKLSNGQITFGPMISTRMFCEIGMKTENAFTSRLQKVKSWKITDGQLELIDETGKPLARFEAAPPPPKPE